MISGVIGTPKRRKAKPIIPTPKAIHKSNIALFATYAPISAKQVMPENKYGRGILSN
jgi:hypothetical protein